MQIEIQQRIHDIKGSMSVLSNLVMFFEPKDEDEQALKDAAKRSIEKISKNLDEIRGIVVGDS